MAVQHARHYRFTVDQYQRLGREGFIDPRARVELIDGEIIEMSPIGPRHNACTDRLARLFIGSLGDMAIVRIQGSIQLDDVVAPQPDVAVLRPRADFYQNALPTPADVILLVEVAEASLQHDRDEKSLRYARAGIEEYWLVDLVENRILLHRQPSPLGYRGVEVKRADESWSSTALPELSVRGVEIFG